MMVDEIQCLEMIRIFWEHSFVWSTTAIAMVVQSDSRLLCMCTDRQTTDHHLSHYFYFQLSAWLGVAIDVGVVALAGVADSTNSVTCIAWLAQFTIITRDEVLVDTKEGTGGKSGRGDQIGNVAFCASR